MALIGHRPGRFRGSVLCALLFGTSMIGHGVFPMGDPRHGLYGIGFFVVLLPLLFVIELRPRPGRSFERQCELTALLVLGHLWSMLAGVDPHGWQGPSQRLAVIPMLDWFSGAAAYLHLRGSDPA